MKLLDLVKCVSAGKLDAISTITIGRVYVDHEKISDPNYNVNGDLTLQVGGAVYDVTVYKDEAYFKKKIIN